MKKRNKLPDDPKRTHTVSVRLSDAELAALDEARGSTQKGAYIRGVIMKRIGAPVPAINRDAYNELSRSASNLNQIARHLNQGTPIAKVVTLLGKELRSFRQALLGVKANG